MDVPNPVFTTEVTIRDSEFVVRLVEFNLIGSGESFDLAMDDLLDVTDAYVEQYLGNLEHYRVSDGLGRLPLVLHIANTEPSDRRSLLIGL
jgi:hypothetical protein